MKLGPRSIGDESLSWVKTPEDGLYALLIAVIKLARRDAKLVPDKCKDPKMMMEAQDALDTAEWFLGHLEYQCRFIGPDFEQFNRRRRVRRNSHETTKTIPMWRGPLRTRR